MAGVNEIDRDVVLVGLVIGTMVFSRFLLTINRTMQQVRPGLRQISPLGVWLCLIPILSVIFEIWMVRAVAASLCRQFKEFEADDYSAYGKKAGLSWIILSLLTSVVSVMKLAIAQSHLAGLAFVASIISGGLALLTFVCWVFYWVQIADFGKQLRFLNARDSST